MKITYKLEFDKGTVDSLRANGFQPLLGAMAQTFQGAPPYSYFKELEDVGVVFIGVDYDVKDNEPTPYFSLNVLHPENGEVGELRWSGAEALEEMLGRIDELEQFFLYLGWGKTPYHAADLILELAAGRFDATKL